MKISLIAKTDIGKERGVNEDAFVVCPNLDSPNWEVSTAFTELGTHGALLAVADGMGGAKAGEVASQLALDTLKNIFSSYDLGRLLGDTILIKEFLQKAVATADNAIDEYAVSHPETLGMGTTIVICWIVDKNAYIAWCGDSRCYVYNSSSGLRLLTKDHSLVQELIDGGELTEETAFNHPDSSIITRGLGNFDPKSVADIVVYPYHTNDVFLLCSDGLSGYCRDNRIEKVLESYHSNTEECCDRLLELALGAGGYDNICIALAMMNDELFPREKPNKQSFFKKLLSKKLGGRVKMPVTTR